MAPLLEAGLTVTLIGMGTVFALLTLLVGVVQLMSRLSRLLEGEAAAPAPAVDPETLSAIGAAVKTFREKRRRPPG